MPTFTTVAAPVTVSLDPVRGSRFVADLAPAASDAAALAVVGTARGRHPDASHHCWALRLANGRARSDDDGEPARTAGPPILRHLEGAGLADVVCVVTRWFGGTRLGTGGLVRAYGAAAAAAIDAADVVTRPVLATFDLSHDHGLTNPVNAVLAAHDATTLDAHWHTRVDLVVTVPLDRADGFVDDLVEATSGRVRPTRRQ